MPVRKARIAAAPQTMSLSFWRADGKPSMDF
jgi:hypothetical protein